jgi:putative endonuclease
MSGWVYILQCSDNSYYTGSTNNLEIRLTQHQNGEGANYTKKRLPVKLIFSQEYERVDEAFYTEKQIQGWSRKKKEALIEGNYEMLPDLAVCLNESHFSNKPTSPFDSAQGPATSVPNLNSVDAAKVDIEYSVNGKNNSSLSGVEGHGKPATNQNKKEVT